MIDKIRAIWFLFRISWVKNTTKLKEVKNITSKDRMPLLQIAYFRKVHHTSLIIFKKYLSFICNSKTGRCHRKWLSNLTWPKLRKPSVIVYPAWWINKFLHNFELWFLKKSNLNFRMFTFWISGTCFDRNKEDIILSKPVVIE